MEFIKVSFITDTAWREWFTTSSSCFADFVVVGAIPQSEAPSESPSFLPSVSFQPSSSPSLSTQPSSSPSVLPSFLPSLSTQPSKEPSLSLIPTTVPSRVPSVSTKPSAITESPSEAPSMSFEPTPSPTARRVFEDMFRGKDIGSVNLAGQSYEAEPGLYIVQGSGLDIWVGLFDLVLLPNYLPCWLALHRLILVLCSPHIYLGG